MKPEVETFGLYARPYEKLLDFPLEFRWELTRRHPYYIVCWKLAKAYLEGTTSLDPELDSVGHFALQLLRHIGVTGKPVDPGTSFEKLNASVVDVDPGFLAGGAQPMTCRAIVELLIAGLPPDDLRKIANLMDAAMGQTHAVSGDDERRTQQRLKVSGAVKFVESQALDSYFDAPLYYLHLAASQRSIVESVEVQVRRWKERLGIPPSRQHTGKLDQYLDVWDARAGWTGEGYELARCSSLKSIAKTKRKALSTIRNQYLAAFERITGHAYSPELWIRIVAPLFAGEKDGLAQDCLRRTNRMVKSQSVLTVAETTLKGSRDPSNQAPGIVGTLPDDSCQDAKDSLIDAVLMIKEGKSNGEIESLLGIPTELVGLIRDELARE